MADNTTVICMDRSKYSEYAFNYYINHLHKPKDKVVLLHCTEYLVPPKRPMGFSSALGFNSTDNVAEILEQERKNSENYAQTLNNRLKSAKLTGKVEQVYGRPGPEIVKKAHDEGATMIITGTRGMGTIKRTLFGSVSDHILHHAQVPVLVCKQKDDVPKHGQD